MTLETIANILGWGGLLFIGVVSLIYLIVLMGRLSGDDNE